MEPHLLYLTSVLALGIGAQWLAWRARLPAILVLLIFGLAAGHFADPDELIEPDLLFAIVSLSVAVILFEGGLSLRLGELRETGRAVLGLVTIGVCVTWLATSATAYMLLGFSPSMATLAGAILVVSGPTVIVPLLRHVRPVRRVGSLVKWEGIVNDPIGAVLAALVLGAVLAGQARSAAADMLIGFVATALVGAAVAAVVALALVQLLKRYAIPDFLQNAVFLTTVLLAFAASNAAYPESGLVTVTLLGILLANQKAVPIKHVVQFKENLRVLLISVLFILLASRLKPAELVELGGAGIAFLAVLLLVVRPAAVLLSTWGAGLQWRERLFLSWMAPRGIVAAAVSSVFALELAHHAEMPQLVADQAEKLVPVTFLVIVGTVTIYGLTAAPLARWLKIADPNPQGILFAGASPFVQAIAAAVQNAGFEVLLVDTNHRNIATARMRGLPTSWANILSAYALEELDLGGIGRLAAMTPNDVVNAMAVREFAEYFGRAGVYQLPPKAAETDRRGPLGHDRTGRPLFAPEASYGRLSQRFAAGAVVKATGLTQEFDYEAFGRLYGDQTIPLMLIEPTGELTICAADSPTVPRPGQTLISLVDPVESESEQAE